MGTESSSKAPSPVLFSSCVKNPPGFPRDSIEELKPRSLSLFSPGSPTLPESIYGAYCTKYLSTPQSSSSASSLRQALSLLLSYYHLLPSAVSPFTHSRTLSFSLTGFTCTLVIFFWRLLYSKRHFLVRFFFFLEILRPQVSITQTRDTALLTSGELFSYILAAPALRSVS